MSAFLGPIHSWLFRKIKLQDELVKAIVTSVVQKEEADELLLQLDNRYGTLEEGALEDIVDAGNIHGWLQERVQLVENRFAFAVTSLTENAPERISEIKVAAYQFGKTYAPEAVDGIKSAYQYLETVLLNGMPCDHVNRITEENETTVSWEQTVDIHEPYWAMIHGRVEYYYAIRESLVIGMFEQTGISYQQVDDQSFELRKED